MMRRFKFVLKEALPNFMIRFYHFALFKFNRRNIKVLKEAYTNPEFLEYYVKAGNEREKEITLGSDLKMSEVTPALGFMFLVNMKSFIVLDFGGGSGNLFHNSRVLYPNKRFDWRVVETSQLIETVRLTHGSLKFSYGESSLSFYRDISEALRQTGKIDLVIASSSLQYLPNPYSSLQELLDTDANVLCISRMPLSEKKGLTIFQQLSNLSDNGPQFQAKMGLGLVRNKVYIPNIEQFRATIKSNYRHVITVIESEDAFPNTKQRIPLYTLIGYK